MFLIIYKGIQAREGTLLILRLVARLSTFDEYLFCFTCVGILPHIAQTDTRFHFVHVLTTGTTGAEGIPFNLTFVDMNLELIGFRQYSDCSGRGVHSALRLSGRHTLYAMHTAFILQSAINIGTADGEVNLLVAAYSSLADTGYRELPALRVAEAFLHLKQVTGKQASFVTTRSGTDLHLHVLGILRVFGNQGYLDFFLQLGL